MFPDVRHFPALIVLAVVLVLHFQIWRWLMTMGGANRSRAARTAASLAVTAVALLMVFGFSLAFGRVIRALPGGRWTAWVRAASLGWAILSIGLFLALFLWRRSAAFNPGRRRLLQAAGGAVAALPVVAGGFGVFVERERITARQVDLSIDGLPPALDGLRIVQLTDIHLSPFFSERGLIRAVDMANGYRAHVAMVTGDLITQRGDPLDACLRQLSRLRASDGVYGCLGNHEGYAGVEAYTAARGRQFGIDFLRGKSRILLFGNARLGLAGVDYQRMGGPYLAGGTALLRKASLNLLMSHNPDVFPTAASQGYDVILAGHTHGGQLTVELLGQSLNISRFFTPFIHGEYRRGRSVLYVSRGLGTVGIPVRIGAPPEVTLVRLRAS